MIDFSEYGLFKKSDGTLVTYEDLLKDIYENAEEDRETVRILVDQMSSLISSPADAIKLMEHISTLMDARVKNSDLLVKVASIVSRLISKQLNNNEGSADWEISEEEKQQLLQQAEDIVNQTGIDTGDNV